MLFRRPASAPNLKFILLSCIVVLSVGSLFKNAASLGFAAIGFRSAPDSAAISISVPRVGINPNSSLQDNRTAANDVNTAPALKKHKYRRDGLVEVNEEGPHPIYELIAAAEAAWERKLQRASKTLSEAVKEYKQRYRRAPPQGFDLWWDYVKENDIQLPDEYDTIFHDLEPFWGMKPTELQASLKDLESRRDSFTFGRTNGTSLGVVNSAVNPEHHDRLIRNTEGILDLLKDVEEHLPPFRLVYNPHDGPDRLSDYGVKSALLQAALTRTHIERKSLPEVKHRGWLSACSPTSPATRAGLDLDSPPPPPSKKSFIYDHRLTMDPCLHPTLFHHHGSFLFSGLGPGPQREVLPTFSQCSTLLHHDIQVPSPYGWVMAENDPEWDERIDERLVWRGRTTGIYHADWMRWRQAHRDFLVKFANEINGTTEVLFPTRSEEERVGKPRKMKNARLNPATMDVGFAGELVGCEEGVCEQVKAELTWKDYHDAHAAGRYKYFLDVDGNGWSGRFKRLITSNALVFKSTIFPEWFMDRIAPWVHYVPVQVDLSDLHDTLFFFRGDGNGENAHEDMARKIAAAGREWCKTYWRREDLVAYMFRLMLEYARVMSPGREMMSFDIFRDEPHDEP